MKSLALKLAATFLLCTFLFSCAKEDDGIFFNESAEAINMNVSYSPIETQILKLVNEHRESIGLNALAPLNIVSGVADGHTNYMVQTGEVSHTNFEVRAQELMDKAGAQSVGENVAYGYNSAEGAVNGWLKSDEHRQIIEDPNYTNFGISTESNSEGRNYFTQIFIKK